MPRAPETLQTSDAFNLAGLADSLSIVTTAGAVPRLAPTSYLVFSQPISHPLLHIHVDNYIKFQVSTAGANYSKWRQIITSMLTMYKAIDHIKEGAAPADPDATWLAVDIHISLWFLATLSDDMHRLVQGTDGWACTTWQRLHRFFLDQGTSRCSLAPCTISTTHRQPVPATSSGPISQLCSGRSTHQCTHNEYQGQIWILYA
jgi:hypothetical protein